MILGSALIDGPPRLGAFTGKKSLTSMPPADPCGPKRGPLAPVFRRPANCPATWSAGWSGGNQAWTRSRRPLPSPPPGSMTGPASSDRRPRCSSSPPRVPPKIACTGANYEG